MTDDLRRESVPAVADGWLIIGYSASRRLNFTIPYLRLNMLDIASNSRPPTTHTNGATTAKPNNQVAITPHLCPTDEPREVLGPQPIPSQPLPKPNCSTHVGGLSAEGT